MYKVLGGYNLGIEIFTIVVSGGIGSPVDLVMSVQNRTPFWCKIWFIFWVSYSVS